MALLRNLAAVLLIAIAASVSAQSNAAGAPYVETLTGQAAKRHLDNLRARRGDVFQRAQAVLRQRGWTDTGRVTVWRTNRELAGQRSETRPGISLIQTYQDGSSEGEVVAWEWEDGDYDTWEGTIYLHEYSTGTWMTVDAQFWLTPENEWSVIWDFVVDGQDSPGFEPDYGVRGSELQRGSILLAKNTEGPIRRVGVDMKGIKAKWAAWAACTAAGCAAAALTCQRLNPTPQEKPDVALCTATMCLGAGVGCLDNLK